MIPSLNRSPGLGVAIALTGVLAILVIFITAVDQEDPAPLGLTATPR